MTSTSGAPSATSISTPLSVILATEARLHDALALRDRLRVLARLGLDELDHVLRGALPVRVGVVVAAEVLVRQLRERMLVLVHRVELVDRVLEHAAGLDRLVRARLDAERAVHADAEVDLVAHL